MRIIYVEYTININEIYTIFSRDYNPFEVITVSDVKDAAPLT